MCRAELGRYPLCIEINCKIVNFYKHIKEMPKDSTAYQTFLMDNSTQGIHVIKALKQHITNLEYITDPSISILPLNGLEYDNTLRSIRKFIQTFVSTWWSGYCPELDPVKD